MSAKNSTFSRRRLIEAASHMMFLWVASASVVIAFAVVALQFIYKDFSFNNEVLKEQNTANQNLTHNINNIAGLKDNVNKLTASTDLASVKANTGEDTLQVVIDALPADSDVTGLPASVQKVLAPAAGVTLRGVGVPTDTAAVASSSASATSTTPVATESKPIEQKYAIEVSGTYDTIKKFIQSLEKSIRPIHINTIDMTGTDINLRATIGVTTYYQPTKSISITQKVKKQ